MIYLLYEYSVVKKVDIHVSGGSVICLYKMHTFYIL